MTSCFNRPHLDGPLARSVPLASGAGRAARVDA